MVDGLCDICNRRPSTRKVRIVENGKSQVLGVCDIDYFSQFDSFFSEELPFSGTSSLIGHGVERHRESIDINQYLSEHSKQLLEQAGQKAFEKNREEVDTEHLLYALSDSDVVVEILNQVRIDPKDIKDFIEESAPREKKKAFDTAELTVSPRVKNVIENAFYTSRELGHGYIGPEHLLIGLSEEEGFAGDLLQKYGLTPQSLRQLTIKVVGKGAKEGRVEKKSTTPQLDKYSRDLTQLRRSTLFFYPALFSSLAYNFNCKLP